MLDKVTEQRIATVLPMLNESQRRKYLAAEAESLGRGGIKAISDFTGVNPDTISAGRKEIHSQTSEQEIKTSNGRIRAEGGGRKSIEELHPEILDDLNNLVDEHSYGNPENPLRWTTKSLRKLAEALKSLGYRISHTTVGRLLAVLGFSLQVNQKMKQVGKESPDRDKQFTHINDTVKEYIKEGEPVISVDCKKKENVGNFKNGGAEYAPEKNPIETYDHDFPIPELGKAIPYGVYDMTNNEGYVNVGVSSETAEFAVQSIRMWWSTMGSARFPNAKRLYITADGGGSNGSRCRLWKVELQKFADETGLRIEVSHFPPGTSKWNKIEHRMFSQISKNWRGRPLETLSVIISLIASTTTGTGLKIQCGLDQAEYQTGIKVSDEALDELNITRNDFHGEWNYVIHPYATCT